MKLSFQITYIKNGWIVFEITLRHKVITLTASYLDDALGNLLNATLQILDGKYESYAVFAEEPGQYCWRLIRKDEETLKVKILWFEEWTATQQNEKNGEVILDVDMPLILFVKKLEVCLTEVLEQYGLEGYKERWQNNDFPLKNHLKLKKAIHGLK